MTTTAPKTWDLTTETAQEHFLQHVSLLRLSGQRPLFQQVDESRSTDQNAMFYALYRDIAHQAEDQTDLDIRRFCKLHFGVPILRRDSEKFRERYDQTIKTNLTYEQKLLSMDILDVTSLMGKKQGSEYIDTIVREYSQLGFALAHPSERETCGA